MRSLVVLNKVLKNFPNISITKVVNIVLCKQVLLSLRIKSSSIELRMELNDVLSNAPWIPKNARIANSFW